MQQQLQLNAIKWDNTNQNKNKLNCFFTNHNFLLSSQNLNFSWTVGALSWKRSGGAEAGAGADRAGGEAEAGAGGREGEKR